MASRFNTLVFGNFYCHNSDTEGRLAAGGDVDIENYAVGCQLYNHDKNRNCIEWGEVSCLDIAKLGELTTSLVAGGNIHALNGEVKAGNIAFGGTYNNDITVRFGPQCVLYHGTDLVDFGQVETDLLALSDKVRNLNNTGSYTSQYGVLTLTGTNADGMEVFNVPGSVLCSANTFTITGIQQGASLFINVDGHDLSCGGFAMNGYNAHFALFNFFEANVLTLRDVNWLGSVLAPKALIYNSRGVLSGQIFAKAWFANESCMQQNWVPFMGCISEPDCTWSTNSEFCTYSGEDWGYNGGGCSRKRGLCSAANFLEFDFDECFEVGFKFGSASASAVLSNKNSVRNFLPQPGNTGHLATGIDHDPSTTEAGEFAGDLVALGLSLDFDKCKSSFSSACANLEDLYVCDKIDDLDHDERKHCGAFYNKKISEIYEIANRVIGQDALPSDPSAEDCFKCVQFIQTHWNKCKKFNGIRQKKFSFCDCTYGDPVNCPNLPASAENIFGNQQVYGSDGLPINPTGSSPAATLFAPLLFVLILLALL